MAAAVTVSARAKKCEQCGKLMTPRVYGSENSRRLESEREFRKRRFCSTSCSATHQHEVAFKELPTEKTCEQCGVQFHRRRWSNGKREGSRAWMARRYCDRVCAAHAIAAEAQAQCRWCGKTFDRREVRRIAFCSAGCQRSHSMSAETKVEREANSLERWSRGLWGYELTRDIYRRIDAQVQRVVEDERLMEKLRALHPLTMEGVEECLRGVRMPKGTSRLFYGTVRAVFERVAKRLRVVA